jgi:hypothetical protein
MNEQLRHAIERTNKVGQEWSNEAQNVLAERILKEIKEIEEKIIEEREEQEWEKLLTSPESIAYWEKRSKELREEHKASKTIEWKPGESFEALFQ